MQQNIIKVHSFESLAALDGPGLRLAVFLSGCNLRCAYCHNPDTWATDICTEYTPNQLAEKILRYKPYFGKNGGVTFSGGEPLLQAKALLQVMEQLKPHNIHIAFDTSANVYNQDVEKVLQQQPMLLLDIKMPDEERYKKYIKGSLQMALNVLNAAQNNSCKVWLRYVVVPTVNDSEQDIKKIIEIANSFSCVQKISLLPYHTIGIEKYKKLGLEYSLNNIQEPTAQLIQKLQNAVEQGFKPTDINI